MKENQKKIGGFISYEYWDTNSTEYHNDCVRVSSGRSCFLFLLNSLHIKRLYLPYYNCNVITRLLDNIGIDYSFYEVDKSFKPLELPNLGSNDYFFYIDYFGICKKICNELIDIYKNKLILDLSMSFFHKPKIKYYFNSCRKFFGVPDGAYIHGLSVNKELNTNSFLNTNHLNNSLTRKDSYNLFLRNESLISTDLHKMSQFTSDTKCLIDYQLVKEKRIKNFNFLNSKIGKKNILTLSNLQDEVPHYYPYLPKSFISRNNLIDKGLFVPNIWKNSKNILNSSSSLKLFENLIPLPIDQRYSFKDMDSITHYLS